MEISKYDTVGKSAYYVEWASRVGLRPQLADCTYQWRYDGICRIKRTAIDINRTHILMNKSFDERMI